MQVLTEVWTNTRHLCRIFANDSCKGPVLGLCNVFDLLVLVFYSRVCSAFDGVRYMACAVVLSEVSFRWLMWLSWIACSTWSLAVGAALMNAVAHWLT